MNINEEGEVLGSQEEEIQEQTEETQEEQAEQEVDQEETEEQGNEEEVGEETEESAEPDPELKAKFFDRLKKSLPDEELESEDQIMSAAMERIDYLEEYYNQNTEANEAVMEVFTQQPEIGNIIKDMAAGASFTEALARHVDLEAVKPEPGDPDYKKWKEAKAEREERIAKAREFEQTLLKNQQLSMQNIENFRQAKNLNPEERDQFVVQVNNVLKGVIEEGLIKEDFLEMMYKALAFENALKEARTQGIVRGKNEAIEQKKAKRAAPDDGLPNLTGQQAVERPRVNKNAASILAWNQKRNRF